MACQLRLITCIMMMYMLKEINQTIGGTFPKKRYEEVFETFDERIWRERVLLSSGERLVLKIMVMILMIDSFHHERKKSIN